MSDRVRKWDAAIWNPPNWGLMSRAEGTVCIDEITSCKKLNSLTHFYLFILRARTYRLVLMHGDCHHKKPNFIFYEMGFLSLVYSFRENW